jgi:predicted MFS family arabinose efflux permease
LATPTRFERDAVTRLAYLMLGLWGFVLYALGPALPELRRELDVSRATVGLHTTLVAVGGIVVGLAGDRMVALLGRKRAFWTAGGVVAAAAAALALARTIVVTLPASFVLGIAGALAVAIIQATLADRHGGLAAAAIVESNALAVAFGAAAPLAIAVAILLGGDWRAVFLGAALLAVPALALAYRTVAFPAPPELPHGETRALPPRYWLYWSALLVFVAIEFCIVFWSTDFLESERELSPSAAAAVSASFLIGMAGGRLGGGRLAREVAADRLLAAALGLTLAGFLTFWLVQPSPAPVVGLVVAGVGVSLLYPLTLSLGIAASGGRTDAASARAAFASGIAIAVAPFALAAIADQAGLSSAYAIVPALLSAGAAIVFVARSRRS